MTIEQLKFILDCVPDELLDSDVIVTVDGRNHDVRTFKLDEAEIPFCSPVALYLGVAGDVGRPALGVAVAEAREGDTESEHNAADVNARVCESCGRSTFDWHEFRRTDPPSSYVICLQCLHSAVGRD